MKLKKSLLAGATAATLAIAGTGIATAQEGSLPTGSFSTSSETESSDLSSITSSLGDGSSEGSGEGSSEGSLSGSSDIDIEAFLADIFGDEGILGSFVTGEDGDWANGVSNITTVISLISAAIGLGSLVI
ncbi:hypothetical protein ACT3SZ_00515 [Corynebacterium sp. AOP40-9SA-29]|uniref:hypothetical protein n=1 Tax=Corynebacterium sp. AOP40-9SA-29 TaxID=3457677 RepID=UPI00403340CD